MPRSSLAVPRQVVRDFGTCLSFAAGSNRVDLATAASLNITSAITLSVWVKTKGSGQVYLIVGYQQGGAFPGYGMRLNSGIPQFYSGPAGWVGSSGTTVVNDGKWHHIVCFIATTTVSFYVDGVLHGTGASQLPNSYSGGRLLGFDGGTGFTGLMDDVRIYNTNLSSDQAVNMYYGIEPPTTNLVGWWKFDEGSGTSATDSSPVGTNTGTITDATYSTDVFMVDRSVAGTRFGVRDFGTCLNFAADGNLVTMTSVLALTGPFTFYTWFKRTGTDSTNGNWIFSSATGTGKFGFLTSGTNFFIRVVDGGSSQNVDIGYKASMNNRWNFLAVVRDGSNNISTSLNGEAFVSVGALSGTTNWIRVGASSTGEAFLGQLDELVVAPTVSTIGEVQLAYRQGLYPIAKSLYYKLDEGSGSTTIDSSGNSNTGTITGAVYTTDKVFSARTTI